MNARTRFTPGIAALALGLAVGLAPMTATAQDVAAAPATSTAGSHVFNLEFDGGTLASFVGTLQHHDPDINILVQDNANDFPVPSMSLKQVNVKACIWTLNQLRVINENSSRELYSDEFVVAGGSPVIVLSSDTSFRGNQAQRSSSRRSTAIAVPGQMQTQVISVGDLLTNGFTPEMILGDIEKMQSLQEGSAASKTKAIIDAKTGLLMMHGSSRQISQAWEVVAALEDSTSYRLSQQRSARRQDAVDAAEAEDVADPGDGDRLSPLTQEQLNQMSAKELRSRISQIAQARKAARGNSELQAQLSEQFTWTLAALDSKRNE